MLRGADFTGAHLQSANLVGAIAERACFDRADFSRARLSGANLVSRLRTPVSLKPNGVRIDGHAVLQGACLDEADMSGAQLDAAVLTGADLRKANLHASEETLKLALWACHRAQSGQDRIDLL